MQSSFLNSLRKFKILDIKIRPGSTQLTIKFNFLIKDCTSLKDDVALFNQIETNSKIHTLFILYLCTILI